MKKLLKASYTEANSDGSITYIVYLHNEPIVYDYYDFMQEDMEVVSTKVTTLSKKETEVFLEQLNSLHLESWNTSEIVDFDNNIDDKSWGLILSYDDGSEDAYLRIAPAPGKYEELDYIIKSYFKGGN